MERNITIKKVNLPPPGDFGLDVDFICRSLGYFSERDKSGTAGKIFRMVVKDTSDGLNGFTSDMIAGKLNLSRGAVVHHLNSFVRAGLVLRKNNRYVLRDQSLQKTIKEVQRDSDRLFSDLLKISKDIDDMLGNHYR